jgi:hypothetical protein
VLEDCNHAARPENPFHFCTLGAASHRNASNQWRQIYIKRLHISAPDILKPKLLALPWFGPSLGALHRASSQGNCTFSLIQSAPEPRGGSNLWILATGARQRRGVMAAAS